MKNATGAGALSGCVVWIIVVMVLSACILPTAMFVGGFTSFSDPAIQFTGSIICPEGTTPDVYSYETTTTNEYGGTQPSTAFVLECLDASGGTVKEDPVGYAFLWMGTLAGIGLIIAMVLAFLLAAPAGVLVARLLKRNGPPQKTDSA
jgi:hypothetical protein